MPTHYKTEVLVEADARDLTILETVKSELGIVKNDHDDVLSRLIHQQSAAAETYCNRVFAKETLVDHLRLYGQWAVGNLILSRYPVESITSIVEDDVTLDAALFDFDPATGIVWRLDASGYPQPFYSNVVATFVAGYELLAELPHDIERAVILMVKQAWYARTRDPLVKSEDVPGVLRQDFWVGTVGENALPPEAASLLDPYRRRMVF